MEKSSTRGRVWRREKPRATRWNLAIGGLRHFTQLHFRGKPPTSWRNIELHRELLYF
jgi:hypothetical protein